MAYTVVLSVTDGKWQRWGNQFVADQPRSRKHLLIGQHPTVHAARDIIIHAVRLAGRDGTLIFNVGHGSGPVSSQYDGSAEIAPNGVMQLVGWNSATPPGFVDVFYDVSVTGPPALSGLASDRQINPHSPRLANWAVYKQISDAFKQTRLHRVVFVSCKIGTATDFVRKIASDWGVVIQAYKLRVEVDSSPRRGSHNASIVYLSNAPPPYATAAQVIAHEKELPFSPADTALIGPPP
jgi:hypothetical protein